MIISINNSNTRGNQWIWITTTNNKLTSNNNIFNSIRSCISSNRWCAKDCFQITNLNRWLQNRTRSKALQASRYNKQSNRLKFTASAKLSFGQKCRVLHKVNTLTKLWPSWLQTCQKVVSTMSNRGMWKLGNFIGSLKRNLQELPYKLKRIRKLHLKFNKF